MDDQDRADEAKRLGIVSPDSTPPFPARAVAADADISDGDKSAIAEAAWKQSGGSMQAFEQLCRDHCAGHVDLLGDDLERQERQRAGVPPRAAGSIPERSGGLAPTTDNPSGAARAPGVGAGAAGQVQSTGTAAAAGSWAERAAAVQRREGE